MTSSTNATGPDPSDSFLDTGVAARRAHEDERVKTWPARRFLKPALVLVAVVGSLLLTVYRDGRTGFGLSPSRGAVAGQTEAGLRDEFRAARLPILSRVIMLVHERYIEPERIDQRAMLLSGLDFIQRSVAEVLVRHDEAAGNVTVRVDTAEQTFPLGDLDRPWTLTFRFREIFRFIQANLRSEETRIQDVEYAAANGLLHTLDPHSVLLSPEVYEEMRTGTRGEFGGLGIVISLRDGRLTIVAPIDGTPAERAGLRRMDRIVMIGDETTVNMTLDEAVDRLRGAPGTKVGIWVERRGWTEPRQFEITRAVIRIESVSSRLLPGGVGYVQIRNFQGNTHDDLRAALVDLRRQGMRSLVLDLRDDPGGLLDQAVRVADAFLEEGVIVTTAGNDPSDRDVRRARPEGTEPAYPIVVLVNSGSASASEIVAGALKGNGRAVLVGERTFGKGSVQVLYDFEDGSALKLTIAHYLTPGDLSIQSVGIVPDIEVVPLSVTRRNVDLEPPALQIRESSLEAHIEVDPIASAAETPVHTIRYYRQPRSAGARPQAGDEDGDERNEDVDRPQEDEPEDEDEREDPLADFEIRLAHDLLRAAGGRTREALLERAATLVSIRQEAENARVVEALRGLGVDWTAGRDRGPSVLDVEVDAGDGTLEAGETLDFAVRVTNRGEVPVFRVHATMQSDNIYFDDRELPFGRIGSGETREWTVQVRVARDAQTRIDPVRVTFTEQHGHAPPDQQVQIGIRGLPRPTFSYSLQVVDLEDGNGDGRLQRGERARIVATVTNQGPGRGYRGQVNLKNESGEGVLIHRGRFDVANLEPGGSRTESFEIEVLPSYPADEVRVRLTITDFDLREEVRERVVLPLAAPAPPPEPSPHPVVSTPRRAPLYEAPDAEGHMIGTTLGGAVFSATAAVPGFVRVDLGEGRPGWLALTSTSPATGVPSPGFEPRMDNTPPEIDLPHPPPLSVADDSVRLVGTVTDADRVLDLYVYVGARKVFYLSNRDGRDPRRLAFDATVPLEPGSNLVLVVARENTEVIARRVLVIRREAADDEGAPPAQRGDR